jgi:hypothetical protein
MSDAMQFVQDMEDAGFEVSDYHGRFYWHGPAVSCDRDEHQEVIRATSVRLQHDQLGLGVIVYPVNGWVSDEEREAAGV